MRREDRISIVVSSSRISTLSLAPCYDLIAYHSRESEKEGKKILPVFHRVCQSHGQPKQWNPSQTQCFAGLTLFVCQILATSNLPGTALRCSPMPQASNRPHDCAASIAAMPAPVAHGLHEG